MKTYILLPLLLIFLSCKESKTDNYAALKDKNPTKTLVNQEHPGKKLMKTNCYVCHNPTASHENRIAPPMIAIKKHYINDKTTKEEFIQSMQSWIKNPTEKNAKMRGAVKRFGVMPKQLFPEETIKQIADYMFENDIEEPEWFQEHFNGQKGKGNGQGKGMHKKNKKQEASKNLTLEERGLQYALSTKAVLGKNLMGKIQKEGTVAALQFCNTKAYPLTDSMAVVNKAKIRRVSDKPRNPKNTANSKEKGYIEMFKKDAAFNKESSPIVLESENNVQFYYPIKTNGMCLQCHGKPNSDIKENTLTQIDRLYPKDLARGYDVNEVRGIWSISFKK